MNKKIMLTKKLEQKKNISPLYLTLSKENPSILINKVYLKGDKTVKKEICQKIQSYKMQDKKKHKYEKDVVYNIDTGTIIEIHGLTFNKKKQKYTLKRTGKKVSTLKCLPRHQKKIEK